MSIFILHKVIKNIIINFDKSKLIVTFVRKLLMVKKPKVYFYKKVVKIPIYGGNFIILFSNDSQKVERFVNYKKEDIDNLYAFTFHNFLYSGYESFCVVFNFWNPNSRISMGTITHEVSHAANKLLLARGVEPDWDNDECEAYIKGWMSDMIEKFMIECNII
jgi:hypothetical protein